MPRKRYKREEIVAKLRQLDVLVLQARSVPRRVPTAINGRHRIRSECILTFQ